MLHRFTLPAGRNSSQDALKLGWAREILCGIYGAGCYCEVIEQDGVVGIAVRSAVELPITLDEIWGYRLVAWDPLVEFAAQQYNRPDLPEDLLRPFMGTVLVRGDRFDDLYNLRDLLGRYHRINLVAIPEECLPLAVAEHIPVVSVDPPVVQGDARHTRAWFVDQVTRPSPRKTMLP